MNRIPLARSTTAALALMLAACTPMKQNKGTADLQEPGVWREEPLGDKVWGLASLSIASGRERPDHKAEMATQLWMGHPFRLLRGGRRWFYVESSDGYRFWLEKGTFVQRTEAEIKEWENSPRSIVTALEDCILEAPQAEAPPVSDVVVGDLVKNVGEAGAWLKVMLPDQRAGFLPKKSIADYAAWKQARRATPENIERTARMLVGRPYLWGGNSPKGLDCSGLTKLVYFLNGIELKRNAGEQALEGIDVPLEDDFRHVQKGDLLFFGAPARSDRPERITHVGLYLGEKLFIQSSERVRISSLDPRSPIRDEHRIRSLLRARRVLEQPLQETQSE